MQAGSPVAVCARVRRREPKTGQKKVKFYCKDDWLCPSCYYLSMLQTEKGEVGWAKVWKTQGGPVRSLTNIYSLIYTVKVFFFGFYLKKHIKFKFVHEVCIIR